MSTPTRKARTTSLHDDAYALFIEALVQKRVKAGMTQRDLAKALGWNQSIIAKTESVQRRLDIIELIRISEVLDFDPARLVRDVQAKIREL
ncbi:MAG: XRE family transcriptional regulator [Proteobacteria bacterium]|nr:MAG: XRE family transcriptional regulator [Pseudomonadota bacterium]